MTPASPPTGRPAPPTPRPAIVNLPNLLTAARFVLALVLFGLIQAEWWGWATGVFAAAAVTDWLDGYLARLQNLTSALGRNFDPLVDKILIGGAFIFLLPLGPEKTGLTAWMVTLVVSRELVVTSLRTFVEAHGGNFGAAWPGKLKMGLQCAALFAVFLARAWEGVEALAWTWVLRDVLIWAMVLSTVHSGADYLWRAYALLREE